MSERRLVWQQCHNTDAIVWLTSTDHKGDDAVYKVSLSSADEALELFHLIDANVGNCRYCSAPLFLEPSGFCGDQDLPICDSCGPRHRSECAECYPVGAVAL